MAKITITVTQEDIDKGRRESSCNCPIALAARRVFVNDSVRVSPFDLVLYAKDDEEVRYRMLPQEAARFIEQFDHQGPTQVKPFSFTVEV